MKLSANILLIDDEINTLELLTFTLHKAGHKVSASTTWDGVVEHIDLATKNKRPFDLIILDLMMPDRSGYDVLRSLKVVLHQMPPVIILSALGGLDDAVKALDLGATKYVTKPTSPQKLLKTIREVLREGSSILNLKNSNL